MIFGHLTATYALREPLKKKFPVLEPLGPLLLGAWLPDLVDKPLAMFFGTPGRGVGHSLLGMALLFLLLFILAPQNRKIVYALAMGAVIHFLSDFISPTVLFWPLLGPFPVYPPLSLGEKLYNYYLLVKHPWPAYLEFASYPFFLYYLVFRKAGLLAKAEAPSIE